MEASLVYPHQLFTEHPALTKDRTVFLVEEPLLLGEQGVHVQKMLFHRMSMKAYQRELIQKGYEVEYLSRAELGSSEEVFALLDARGVNEVHVVDTTDNWLEKRLKKACTRYGWKAVRYESPLFILSKEEARERFVASKKHMAAFYKALRKDKGILMEGTEPAGGKWSYDEENRKKVSKGHELPGDIEYFDNEDVQEALEWLESLHELEMYGERKVWLPYTRDQALEYLEEFLQDRFGDFGVYEDAIEENHVRLNHSTLSPLINVGLLGPQEVVDRALEYAKDHEVPLNSLEGFVRQIIGWREFVRASYEVDGSAMREQNFFSCSRKLDEGWWIGETKLVPLDCAISRALRYGYTHHIERLMVVGNAMLLCELHPHEVYRWFMAMYVDAYDWVMVPNVFGMSQFADGGSFATKPYIAGANYLKKMSHYKKGEWEEVYTALYWNFVATHQEVFLANHRMSMMPRLLSKMDEEKRKSHIDIASRWVKKLTYKSGV